MIPWQSRTPSHCSRRASSTHTRRMKRPKGGAGGVVPAGQRANKKPLLPPGVIYTHSAYEAAEGADGLAIVTEWNEFRFLNMERVKQAMRRPIIFDGRNVYEPERIRRLGFA